MQTTNSHSLNIFLLVFIILSSTLTQSADLSAGQEISPKSLFIQHNLIDNYDLIEHYNPIEHNGGVSCHEDTVSPIEDRLYIKALTQKNTDFSTMSPEELQKIRAYSIVHLSRAFIHEVKDVTFKSKKGTKLAKDFNKVFKGTFLEKDELLETTLCFQCPRIKKLEQEDNLAETILKINENINILKKELR